VRESCDIGHHEHLFQFIAANLSAMNALHFLEPANELGVCHGVGSARSGLVNTLETAGGARGLRGLQHPALEGHQQRAHLGRRRRTGGAELEGADQGVTLGEREVWGAPRRALATVGRTGIAVAGTRE